MRIHKSFARTRDEAMRWRAHTPRCRIAYLLAVPPEGRGQSDALNLRYPTLYDTGADIATLELEIPNDGDSQPNWRLDRVNEPVSDTAPG